MSAEELLTAADIQEEENQKEQPKEVESEDQKGLMDEIMEVISRGSASEEERQSTPSAIERSVEQEKEEAAEAKEELQESGEEVEIEAKNDDEPATQEAREPLPAEEEANAAGDWGMEMDTAQADTAASTDPSAGEDPAPVAAEEEGKVEEGEGKVEPTDKAEPDVVSAPVDVTTSYLISNEDVLAKGISEDDMERFKQYHLKAAFGVQSWYQSLKEHTFETEFITLTKKQVEVLGAASHPFSEPPELSEEQREVLGKLEEEIDVALAKFGDDGAFIKLDTCSARDSVLDRKDADHIQAIKDGVVDEMEIEKQFDNAYLIWRSWRSSSFRRPNSSGPGQEGRLRRSFRRIQNTFSRPRAQSSLATPKSNENEATEGKNEDPLVEVTTEETKAEGGEQKEEKTEAEAGADAEKAEDKKDEEMEGEGESGDTGAITVEAIVEAAVEPKEAQQAEAAVVEEENKVEEKEEDGASPEEDSSPPADSKEEEVQDAPVVDEPKEKKAEEGEKKEEQDEDQKEEEVEGVDETPADKSEEKEEGAEANGEEKKKPRSVKKKVRPVSEEYANVKVKEEPTQNKVLRALMRTTTQKYRITTGKQAVEMLLTSARVKEELTLIHTFGDHMEDYETVLCVRRWNEQVPRYPGMQFRGFVCKNRLTALSQYDDMVYIPNIIRFKSTIQKKILSFFNAHVKRAVQDHDNYLIDIFVAPNEVYIIKLSPFHTSSGACLFTWREHKEVLTSLSRSIKFYNVSSPKPNCFSGLQSWWQSPLESVVQEHKKIEEPQHGQRCAIL